MLHSLCPACMLVSVCLVLIRTLPRDLQNNILFPWNIPYHRLLKSSFFPLVFFLWYTQFEMPDSISTPICKLFTDQGWGWMASSHPAHPGKGCYQASQPRRLEPSLENLTLDSWGACEGSLKPDEVFPPLTCRSTKANAALPVGPQPTLATQYKQDSNQWAVNIPAEDTVEGYIAQYAHLSHKLFRTTWPPIPLTLGRGRVT